MLIPSLVSFTFPPSKADEINNSYQLGNGTDVINKHTLLKKCVISALVKKSYLFDYNEGRKIKIISHQIFFITQDFV